LWQVNIAIKVSRYEGIAEFLGATVNNTAANKHRRTTGFIFNCIVIVFLASISALWFQKLIVIQCPESWL